MESRPKNKRTGLTLVRRIGALPSTVFDALTTAQSIASWWGPPNGSVVAALSDPHVGGGYLVRFRTSDGFEHECRGEYLEIVEPKRIAMSFRWVFGGTLEEIGNTSRVEVELREIAGETELTFTHANLNDGSKESRERAWDTALMNLALTLNGIPPVTNADRSLR